MVDGQEITTLDPKELRKARQSITMIFQGFNLLMQRTRPGQHLLPAGARRRRPEGSHRAGRRSF